uniref:Uncharacterized protein n=1 Tax=Coccidioides posadasii RMSCC 3488 TaxID=454284 RepID=A0A0J6I2W2_COCPO|nr:hypothetical protein CPAG_02023 [Coccidioides posadasii RMSCC 3488]
MVWMPTLPKSPSTANGSSVEYHMVVRSPLSASKESEDDKQLSGRAPTCGLPTLHSRRRPIFRRPYFGLSHIMLTLRPRHRGIRPRPLFHRHHPSRVDRLWLLDSLEPGPRRDLMLIFFFLLSFTPFFLLDDGAQQVTRLGMFQSQRSVSAPPRRLIVTPTEIPTVAKPSPLSLDMGHNYGSQLGIQPPSGSPQLEARLRAPSLGISAFHKHDSTQNIIPFENAISKQRPAAGFMSRASNTRQGTLQENRSDYSTSVFFLATLPTRGIIS